MDKNRNKLSKVSGGWTANVTAPRPGKQRDDLDIKADPGENISVREYACMSGKCAEVRRNRS